MNVSYNDKFHRSIIFTNAKFQGRFKYRDIFQLLPPNKSWLQPENAVGNFPLILEYNSDYIREYSSVKNERREFDERPDAYKNWIKSRDFEKELLALLNLSTSFFFYQDREALSKMRLNRKKLGKKYFRKTFRQSSIPDIKLDDDNKVFLEIPHLGQETVFPKSIFKILDRYFNLEGEYLDAFRMSIFLLYKGREIKYSTASLAFLAYISSIESLIKIEYKDMRHEVKESCCDCHSLKSSPWTCHKCNKPIWGISHKFREFLLKYGSSTEVFRKYANKLYSRRSKIAHEGLLLQNDFSTVDLDWDSGMGLFHTENNLRVCIVSWLLTYKT